MQSLLIFIAEFQTAKSRLLKNFGLSDHGGFSEERDDDDAQGREERITTIKPWKRYSMYEREETTSYGVLPDTLRRNQNPIG
jgi:hypothetical protein